MGLQREEVVDVFRKGKYEPLTLTETKLKINGDISWCGVNGIVGVQIERVRGGMAVLMIDEWHSVVISFGCVSSRIL